MLDTLLQKGAEPLKWLLVVGIAYTLAMTIWVFFATPIAPVQTPQSSSGTSAPNRPKANVNWILNKNLFGQAGQQSEISTVQEAAVQTRLPLELQSVMVSTEEERSSAIVAQRGKAGILYRIGDTLPGNAELVGIEHTEIYLRRAGVRESLAFPKSKSTKLTTTTTQPQANRQPVEYERYRDADDSVQEESNGTESLDSVSEYRERFADDAQGTLEDLGVEVAEGGGYRIGNLAQTPALRQTGLQAGDIILSVNGRPVGDLQQDQLELDNILAQGSARIEVRRGERRFFITASLPTEQ